MENFIYFAVNYYNECISIHYHKTKNYNDDY